MCPTIEFAKTCGLRANFELLGSAVRRGQPRTPKPSKEIVARIHQQIVALADDPRPRRSKKLRSKTPEGWRIRVGDYRILYRIDDPKREVIIYRIGHRREVYD